MPARRHPGSKLATRLAEVRHWRGVTQEELADRVGMSHNTYRRLERDELPNPPLRSLVNCAKALGVPLDAVLEPNWLQWFGGQPEPPEEGFWPTRELTEQERRYHLRSPREPPAWLRPYLQED